MPRCLAAALTVSGLSMPYVPQLARNALKWKKKAEENKPLDWAGFSAKLPTERDEEASKKRKAIFRACDDNGSGAISLPEVTTGLLKALGNEYLPILDRAKPAIARAFAAANRLERRRLSGRTDTHKVEKVRDEQVTPKEFRALLAYMRQYFELWVMFETLDGTKSRPPTRTVPTASRALSVPSARTDTAPCASCVC